MACGFFPKGHKDMELLAKACNFSCLCQWALLGNLEEIGNNF